jgi:hypothetical protein
MVIVYGIETICRNHIVLKGSE